MSATLKSIAQSLNLSPTLVSRVLNNKPGVWASEKTRTRILEAANKLNYRPSASARALITGRSMQIAISAADHGWEQGSSVRLAELRGLINAAATQNYRVLVLPSQDKKASREQYEGLVYSSGCDGYCVFAEQGSMELYSFFCDRRVPYVIVGNPGSPEHPQVDHDNYRNGFKAVEWLQQLGHKRIGYYAAFSPTEPPHLKLLRDGYAAAMTQFCGGYDPAWLGNLSLRGDSLLQFVRTANAPTAMIIRGLADTIRWKTTLQLNGVRVPEDMTLLSQLNLMDFQQLRRTELHAGIGCQVHNAMLLGERAAGLLLEWISGQPPADKLTLITDYDPCWGTEFKT